MNRRDRERGREEKTHTAFSSFSFLLNQTTESKRKTWRTALEKKRENGRKRATEREGVLRAARGGFFVARFRAGEKRQTTTEKKEETLSLFLAHAFLLSSLSRAASSAVERDNAGERASERKGAPFCACACNDFEMLRVCKRKKGSQEKPKKRHSGTTGGRKTRAFFLLRSRCSASEDARSLFE